MVGAARRRGGPGARAALALLAGVLLAPMPPRAAAQVARPVPSGVGVPVYIIHEPDLFPEGICLDPATGSLLVGSTWKRKILLLESGRAPRELVPPQSGGLWAPLGLRVDPARRRLWVCAVASKETPMQGERPPFEGSAVFVFDADSGAPLRRVLATTAGDTLRFVNDLVLDKQGNAWVTDSGNGAVYRIGAEATTAEVIVPAGRFHYPNGITFTDEERSLVVAAAEGLVRVDPRDGSALLLPKSGDFEVRGIDGLYSHGQDLVGIQNGVRPERVVRIRLTETLDRVTGVDVLERGNPLFIIPTTGAIAPQHRFYYLADSQMDSFVDGAPAPADSLHDIVILEMILPGTYSPEPPPRTAPETEGRPIEVRQATEKGRKP